MFDVSRRRALAALSGAGLLGKAQTRPEGYLVENTLRMCAGGSQRPGSALFIWPLRNRLGAGTRQLSLPASGGFPF
jgi:hypothetical protein